MTTKKVSKVVKEVATKQEETKFTKEQIIKAKKYRDRRDLVNAILVNNNSYTLTEVDELINKFMKGSVN